MLLIRFDGRKIFRVKILFYFNHDNEAYHFQPLVDYIHQNSTSEIFFYSASKVTFFSDKGHWLRHMNEVISDVVVFNEAPESHLSAHGFLLNVSLHLISKGKYYLRDSEVYKSNLIDAFCVPGPWHKSTFKDINQAKVYVTGSLQMDELLKPLDKNSFCQKHSVSPSKPIVLWRPTHEMELSSIVVLWSRIQVLTPQYQVVMFLSPEIEELFRSHYFHLSQSNPDLLIVEEDIVSWMKVSSLMISDFTQEMFEYLILDRPVVVVDSSLQVDDPCYHPENFEYQYRDIGPRISHSRDLLASVTSQLDNPQSYQQARQTVLQKLAPLRGKSACEQIFNIINSLSPKNSEEKTLMAVVVAPDDMKVLARLASNPFVGKVFAYQPQIPIVSGLGFEVIASAHELLNLAEQLSHELFYLEFGPGSIVGNDVMSLIRVLQNNHSVDMVGPLTIGSSQLAKVQNHMKMHLYQLEQQVSPESLADFIQKTNDTQTLLVPELDTSCLVVRASVIKTLAQVGLEATLSSPRHLKSIVKDRILV